MRLTVLVLLAVGLRPDLPVRWVAVPGCQLGRRAPSSLSDAVDRDRDGIADAREARIARDYLPYLSLHPDDACPLAAIVYRLRPHPCAAELLHLTAVVLFERDCGAVGHLGDDEVFGMTIDPRRRGAAGVVALRTIAHKATLCSHDALCGTCAALRPCVTARRRGQAVPVVFYSRGKHGGYLDTEACAGACFLSNWCRLSPVAAEPRMVNVGEPDAPLVRDLTRAGLLTPAAGWRQARLLGHDPWGGSPFGDAGTVARDLQDPAFLTPTCRDGR